MKDFTYENIKSIDCVTPSKKDGYIKIDMSSNDGFNPSLMAEYGSYCKWLKNNKGTYKDIIGDFVKSFMDTSKEGDMNEIVDKDGNIYPDDDKPNNATNRMVGSSKFDLDKTYRQTVPRNSRYYSGDLGRGIITW